MLLIWNLLTAPAFAVFIIMLVALMVFHHHKTPVVVLGFLILVGLYGYGHGWAGLAHHFSAHHEYHLLYNLALLLPGFGLVAHYFETSGFDRRLSKYIDSDRKLLWAVFFLSAILDNIAAAMIGAVLLITRYGKPDASDTTERLAGIPFFMIVAVIGTSNLGGAYSFAGDTTTVMMFIAGVGILTLGKAAFAAFPAQVFLNWCVARGGYTPNPPLKGQPTPVQWQRFWPLLAVPGLALGNIAYDQPGIGLWVGLLIGMLIGKTALDWRALKETFPNTVFLVLLVAAAGLLPLEQMNPILDRLSKDEVAVLLGVLSPWFDNIPLTKLAIDIGGFDWGLLAYAVGFAGTAMWFGSSAGVAVGLKIPETYNTRRWIVPFFVVMGVYAVGIAAYMLVFHGLMVFAEPVWLDLVAAFGVSLAAALLFTGAILINYLLARQGLSWFPGSRTFRTWLREARQEWH